MTLKTYPNFLIICQNCGYTYFFNAVMAGIVEKDKPQENQEENPPIKQKVKELIKQEESTMIKTDKLDMEISPKYLKACENLRKRMMETAKPFYQRIFNRIGTLLGLLDK